MSERKLTLNIIGDASSLNKALGSAEAVTGRFSGGLGGLFKQGLLIGAGMDLVRRAIDGAVGVLRDGYAAFKEQQGVMAQTDAVLKSTAGSANMTKKQISDLAGSLAALTGQDDMAIQHGENLLATFTNIRNETGKGNDIFNQATKSMVDMSVALGQDTKSSAIQLGKALNDPIKGVTALQRVGVSFTEDQKKQIKTLVESGKTMEAQKLILAELNKEFGGSGVAAGKTYEGQVARISEMFEDLKISIIEKALPAATWFMGVLTDNFPKVEAVVNKVMDNIGVATIALLPVVKPVLENLKSVIAGFFDGSSQKSEAFKAVFETVGYIVSKTAAFMTPIVRQLGVFILQQFGTIIEWVKANWPLISATIKTVMDVVKAVFDYTWPVVQAVVMNAFNVIKIVVSTGINAVLGIIKMVMQIITGDWSGAWESLKGVVKTVFGGIVKLVENLIEGYRDIGENLVKSIWKGMSAMASWIAARVREFISDHITRPIKSALGISSPSKVFTAIGENIGQGLAIGIDQSSSLVQNAMGAINPTSSLNFGLAGTGSFSSFRGVARSVAGNKIEITITGNRIDSRYDIERIGDDLIAHLRRKGMKI